jgi:hypothetical protein
MLSEESKATILDNVCIKKFISFIFSFIFDFWVELEKIRLFDSF